jgi:excinuclease ABC subunit B
MGNNLKAHLEALAKQMRDAAADLDFEKAARLRDEIKRLREMELAISDDPMARDVEAESPASGREKGKHNKGVARHRTADGEQRKSLFAKPELDDMGTSGAHATPAGAIDRSLFRKQDAREAHGSDYGMPNDGKSLFRKNSLDEMTVRRTEKPIEGVKPVKREKIGAGSYEDPGEARAQGRRSRKSGRPGH